MQSQANDHCEQHSIFGLTHSDMEVLNELLVYSIVELLDGLVNLPLEDLVSTFNHFFICHHIVVKAGLNDILRYHTAQLGAFIEER